MFPPNSHHDPWPIKCLRFLGQGIVEVLNSVQYLAVSITIGIMLGHIAHGVIAIVAMGSRGQFAALIGVTMFISTLIYTDTRKE